MLLEFARLLICWMLSAYASLFLYSSFIGHCILLILIGSLVSVTPESLPKLEKKTLKTLFQDKALSYWIVT